MNDLSAMYLQGFLKQLNSQATVKIFARHPKPYEEHF